VVIWMSYRREIDKIEINAENIKIFAKKAYDELKPFFEPKAIAVVGASRDVNSPGWVTFKMLLESSKKGVLKAKVYGVNVKGGELFGQKLYKTITEIPDEVDHAVILVPAKYVPSVLEECGKKGVKVATIISAGFSEVGNIELEQQVLQVAKEQGIRVMGPNGLGVFDTWSGVDTMFLPTHKEADGKELLACPRPKKGHIMFLSQSGALGVSVLDYMYGEGIGLSKFISYGNKIDVDEVDMLLWALEDPTVRAVMIYMEGIKSAGRTFVKVARQFSKHKPIIILKGGKTKAGARAVASHTASLAGDIKVYEAAVDKMGAVWTDDLIEFLDATKALVYQPPAAGNNIAIVTDGGGAGILASDKAEKIGLNLPPTPESVLQKLKNAQKEGKIPSVATFANPIDVSGSASDISYEIALDAVLENDDINAAIVIALHHPPLLTSRFIDAIARVGKKYKKPVVAVDIGGAEMARWVRDRFDEYGVPSFSTPERGIVALRALVKYGNFLRREGVLEDYLEHWKPVI